MSPETATPLKRVLFDKVFDAVDGAEVENDTDLFCVAHALLALSLSRLPAASRDTLLSTVEGGSLRDSLDCFPEPLRMN
jgi:hypothetical protein